MEKRKRRPSIAVIGPGRIGQAMGRLLAEAGESIAFVAGRRLSMARRAARFVGAGEPVTLSDPRLRAASILLITTADSTIPEVAQKLCERDKGKEAWRDKIVLHTCGSLPSEVLRPLKLLGAAIGSLHPYQTVPSPQAGIRNLRNCYWALEGDARALRVARGWVKLLGGVAFPVRPVQKTLYHLSAFIVCPALVTLMAQSATFLNKAGVPPKIARPMLRQFVAETARNFEESGARGALTGPVVRGDWATIRRHLAAIRKSDPKFEPVYQSLLKAMLRLSPGKESAQRR